MSTPDPFKIRLMAKLPFKLQFATIVAAAIFTSAEVYVFVGGPPDGGLPSWYRHGWPLIFAIKIGRWLSGPAVFFSGWCLVADAIVGVVGIAGIVAFTEYWARSLKSRFQFALNDLLLVIAAFATMLAMATQERVLFAQKNVIRMEIPSDYQREEHQITRRILQPAPARLVLYFGVACAVFGVLKISGLAAMRLAHSVRKVRPIEK